MKIKTGMFFESIILVAIFIAGCLSPETNPAPSTAIATTSGADSRLSTLEPQQMVLHASDLPAGYMLTKERPINTSQLDPSIWSAKKGYQVEFSKGSHATGIEIITETIVVEPIDKVGQQIPILTGYYAKYNGKPVQLPGPVVGDASIAIIVPGRADWGPGFYSYIFTRKDVVIELMMNSRMDNNVLQSIVEKAAEKIQ